MEKRNLQSSNTWTKAAMASQNVFSSPKIIIFFKYHFSKCDIVKDVAVICYLILLGLWCPLMLINGRNPSLLIKGFKLLHRYLFQKNLYVGYSHNSSKVLESRLGHLSFSCIFRYWPVFMSYLLVGSTKEIIGSVFQFFYILTLF